MMAKDFIKLAEKLAERALDVVVLSHKSTYRDPRGNILITGCDPVDHKEFRIIIDKDEWKRLVKEVS